MTKVLFHGSIEGFRGRIGDLIFRLMPDGTTVVTQAPPKKNSKQKKRAKLKRTTGQKAHNDRFHSAIAYAKQAAKVHPIYAERAAATTMRTAYNFALSDWFKAPVIHHIQTTDGYILVQATDNISVAKVRVTVFDAAGGVLEQGNARLRDGDWWEYPVTAQGQAILAEAWDLPGNVARRRI